MDSNKKEVVQDKTFKKTDTSKKDTVHLDNEPKLHKKTALESLQEMVNVRTVFISILSMLVVILLFALSITNLKISNLTQNDDVLQSQIQILSKNIAILDKNSDSTTQRITNVETKTLKIEADINKTAGVLGKIKDAVNAIQ